MIALEVLVEKYHKIYKVSLSRFIKYFDWETESYSMANLDETIINEDYKILEPYISIIVMRNMYAKDKNKDSFKLSELNKIELKFFTLSNELINRLKSAGISEHGYDSTIQIELRAKSFKHWFNIWPNMISIGGRLFYDGSICSLKRVNTDLLYNSVANDL